MESDAVRRFAGRLRSVPEPTVLAQRRRLQALGRFFSLQFCNDSKRCSSALNSRADEWRLYESALSARLPISQRTGSVPQARMRAAGLYRRTEFHTVRYPSSAPSELMNCPRLPCEGGGLQRARGLLRPSPDGSPRTCHARAPRRISCWSWTGPPRSSRPGSERQRQRSTGRSSRAAQTSVWPASFA